MLHNVCVSHFHFPCVFESRLSTSTCCLYRREPRRMGRTLGCRPQVYTYDSIVGILLSHSVVQFSRNAELLVFNTTNLYHHSSGEDPSGPRRTTSNIGNSYLKSVCNAVCMHPCMGVSILAHPSACVCMNVSILSALNNNSRCTSLASPCTLQIC